MFSSPFFFGFFFESWSVFLSFLSKTSYDEVYIDNLNEIFPQLEGILRFLSNTVLTFAFQLRIYLLFFSSELSQNRLSVSSGKHGKQYSQTKVTKSEKCLMEISYAALKIIINFLYEHFPSIRQKLLHTMKSCVIYKFWGHAAILKVLISGRGSYNKMIFQHFIKSTIHT